MRQVCGYVNGVLQIILKKMTIVDGKTMTVTAPCLGPCWLFIMARCALFMTTARSLLYG